MAAGTYAEELEIKTKSITIQGRCAKLVTIKGQTATNDAAVVKIGASGVALRDLTVTGPVNGIEVGADSVTLERISASGCGGSSGVLAKGASALTLRDALVAENKNGGIYLSDTDAKLERVVVRDTKPKAADQTRGYGIVVVSETRAPKLRLEDCVISGNRDNGVGLVGAAVTAVGTVIRDTTARASDNTGGWGIYGYRDLQFAASVTLEESLVANNTTIGVVLLGGKVTLTRSVVRDTQPQPSDKRNGVGIHLNEHGTPATAGTLELKDSLVTHNRQMGILLVGSNGTLVNSMVQETSPQVYDGTSGVGVSARQGATQSASLSMDGCLVASNRQTGVQVAGAKANLQRTVVRDTRATTPASSTSAAANGFGVQASDDATLSMKDCLVEKNQSGGLAIFGVKATVEGTVIRDTLAAPDKTLGGGIGVAPDNVLGSTATIQRSIVRETRADLKAGRWGDGIQAANAGAKLEIADSLVESSSRAGLLFVRAAGSVQRTVLRKGLFSLVRTKGAKPRIGDDNVFENNQQDLPLEKDLTPTPAPKLPAAGL